MTHLDEDTIIKFQLEVLDKKDLNKIEDHLRSCEICSSKLNKVKNQINLINSYNPKIEEQPFLIKRNVSTLGFWLKRAAVFLIIFLLGYYIFLTSKPTQVIVSKQQLVSKPPTINLHSFVECRNIDIYQNTFIF